MTYRIEQTMNTHFIVFMAYNSKKVVELADKLDADPKLYFCEYRGNKKAEMHSLHLRVVDEELRHEGAQAMKAYIDAICKPILSDEVQNQ